MVYYGVMDKQRILQLALESLTKERAGIEAEIAGIQAQLKPRRQRRTKKTAAKKTRNTRQLTAAEKKKASERMKEYWKQKKAGERKAQ